MPLPLSSRHPSRVGHHTSRRSRGVLRVFGGVDEGDAPRLVMRMLGGRHLIQAAAEFRLGGRAREMGILVDLLHGATSVVFASSPPPWRRAALIDASVATGFAASRCDERVAIPTESGNKMICRPLSPLRSEISITLRLQLHSHSHLLLSKLATTLMTRPTITAPNRYEIKAWRRAVHLIGLVFKSVSETWKVIPIVKAR